MEEWKLGYLGGIIDGEGTIVIAKTDKAGNKRSFHYSAILSVTNTDKRLMDWLKENVGGGVYIQKEAIGNHRKRYMWVMYVKGAYELLKEIKPYLVIKQEQADVWIEFYELSRWRVKNQRVPVWLLNKREVLYQRMKELHVQ